jgi:tetratricopeptide (TPR) repeat protein
LPTYPPGAPDKNPMFLERRVYQGSSGRVYPLPFTDRIADRPVDRQWEAVWLENEFVRVLLLPEIGGRIHRAIDKTNHYDFIYYQPVIKPALVGLAGPWISGGIEFNWPQHHRPGTFLPVDFEIEEHRDGSKTVWCGDHDPLLRMKGMHGVCLHPGSSCIEVKVRAYNRTPFVQTFLWWMNVATPVHEAYQSFFPPDVRNVADHARRSTSAYPLAQGSYYGVNYGARARFGVPAPEVPRRYVPRHCGVQVPTGSASSDVPDYAPNDLSYYANIPTPCSYMCVETRGDFLGGYDYRAQAGVVHVANHHVAPGKKQWTWGNHEFGYAWDRNLTDPDERGERAPYVELMAGVYTDNQPDFSFLQPDETKTWSQYLYPIRSIGPAQQANLDAAVSLRRLGGDTGEILIGVAVTRPFPKARVVVSLMNVPTHASRGRTLARIVVDLAPGAPLVNRLKVPRHLPMTDVRLRVTDAADREIIAYHPEVSVPGEVPRPATEPPPPARVESADELYVTGLHLDQYRHATRCPTLYWREALRRDSLDSRCNNAMGLWHLKRGEFNDAERHFRRAIARLTCRNANPRDGEPHYNLGLCLRYRANALPCFRNETSGGNGPDDGPRLLTESYAAFYKATWNQAWAAAAYHALAEIDCVRGQWGKALEHLNRSLNLNTDNLRARDLKVIVLRKLGRYGEGNPVLRETLELDRLDSWARHLAGDEPACDLQTRLDIAHDYARAGFYAEAAALLKSARVKRRALPDGSWGAQPLIAYTLGWLRERLNEGEQRRSVSRAALHDYRAAAALSPDYCFPARIEEIAILEAAARANPRDARAPYYLGNLLYDRGRHLEAIRLWEKATLLDPAFSVAWRNLGIGYYNECRQPARACGAYERAVRAAPADARLLYERDQLWKRLGAQPGKRLRVLESHKNLVRQRDDLSVELCALYNQVGRHKKALELIASRQFQPWEGGEGGPLGQWVRAHLALGRIALLVKRKSGHPGRSATGPRSALDHFEAALTVPGHLGEARHLLANPSDVYYWLGCALEQLEEGREARRYWQLAATFKGDFQSMSVRAFSEMTYYSALAWERLGQRARAKRLFRSLLQFGRELERADARVDYFATSLPAMLLFKDDLQFRQETTALFLQAQAHLGLGSRAKARTLLQSVLDRDPNHAPAGDLVAELACAGRKSYQAL